jgi:hypothetical protein
MERHLNTLNKITFRIILIVLFFWFPVFLFSQDIIKITRLITPIEFDGMPKEGAWETLTVCPLTMHKPIFNQQPSEISEVRIGYDNEFLWIGARLYMHDASKIFAVTKKRDEELSAFDAFGIILDTYNDNENGLGFFTTPTGTRSDFTISNDATYRGAEPGKKSDMSYSWNTYWDVKTTRDEKGWYLEMRIPFSSLKFKTENEIATMGIIISRIIGANNEIDTYPSIDPKYGQNAVYKPSLARKAEIEGTKPTKPIYISPYIIGGFSRDWKLNDDETDYLKEDKPQINAGLDIKYNINSNLTLDLTGNTDFAQVEADDQQVNLTRYSLSFPEKRAFFQERSSLFDFTLAGKSDNIFYSRRIGIIDDEPIRIYGGARLTGRIGKWDIGLLDMQTEEHEGTPGENFSVLRMKRQVINTNSYVGGIMTSRLGMNGTQNLTYGLDGMYRMFGDDYLNVKWAQSYDNNIGSKMNSLDPSFILVNWTRRTKVGFNYKFNYAYSGRNFNPGVGFVKTAGVQSFINEMNYGWIPGEKSKLFNYILKVKSEGIARLEDGKLESLQIAPEIEINTKSGIRAAIIMEINKEGVLKDFNLSDSIIVKSGTYSFIGFQGELLTPNSRMLSFTGKINGGQFYDGMTVGLEAGPNFNISSSLKLTATYLYNAIRFPDRATNNSLDIHSLNVKVLYMFSTKLSASMLAQYVNTNGNFITNFRLRYNPREGNDFYIVLNDYRGISKTEVTPALPAFFNRTIMVKFVHTFIL